MAKFEVHIPASEPGGFNMTLKVVAANWMAALKAGMQKLGEQGTVSQNVMVDVQDDNSIHVTEAASGRVFRIRELTEDEVARAQVKRPSQIRPAPVPASTRSELKTDPARPAVAAPTFDDRTQPGNRPAPKTEVNEPFDPSKTMPAGFAPPPAITEPAPPPVAKKPPPEVTKIDKRSGPVPAPVPPPGLAPLPRRQPAKSKRIELNDVQELVQPINPVMGNIGRQKSSPTFSRDQRVSTEDLLSDIFLRVVELDRLATLEEAMNFVIDLAMEKVPCESASVFRADGATGDLTFITARGPRARQVLTAEIVIPAGEGIAGFCSAEGVSVAVSDVEKDPRFYAAVGEKVDYETKSLLCAPMMTHGRSFGCMQLINRKGGPQFQEHEIGVLAYLAHQAALYMNNKLLQ
jgi:hypothetical protein